MGKDNTQTVLPLFDCESISSTVSKLQGRVGYKCQRERVRSAASMRSQSKSCGHERRQDEGTRHRDETLLTPVSCRRGEVRTIGCECI